VETAAELAILADAAKYGALVRDAPQRVRRMVEQAGLPPELQRPPRRSDPSPPPEKGG
jgi:hypothetical protein